jgi:hypothetical protein
MTHQIGGKLSKAVEIGGKLSNMVEIGGKLIELPAADDDRTDHAVEVRRLDRHRDVVGVDGVAAAFLADYTDPVQMAERGANVFLAKPRQRALQRRHRDRLQASGVIDANRNLNGPVLLDQAGVPPFRPIARDFGAHDNPLDLGENGRLLRTERDAVVGTVLFDHAPQESIAFHGCAPLPRCKRIIVKESVNNSHNHNVPFQRGTIFYFLHQTENNLWL